jgi:subtilisin family serine protease
MKKNWLLIAIVILLLVAAGVLVAPRMSSNKVTPIATNHKHSSADGPATPAQGAKLIPAYLQQPPSRSSLSPTLAPEKFEGLTRDAYKAVRDPGDDCATALLLPLRPRLWSQESL